MTMGLKCKGRLLVCTAMLMGLTWLVSLPLKAAAPDTKDCSVPGACPLISPWGDDPSGLGAFHGFADPALARDPDVPGRVWLMYSRPHAEVGTAPDGSTVLIGAVSSQLARSDNSGTTFTYIASIWPDVAMNDPEGSGQRGIINSETPALATINWGGTTIWYGAHLRYFQQPKTGYYPKYGTSWHIRIGAATSPLGLATAPETVLGVSTTADVYRPRVFLDQLAGRDITSCAMLNNPTLFAQGTTLYLITECLAFNGTEEDFTRSTTLLFATTPLGTPTSWSWRYVGVLADHAVALELGGDTVLQPTLSRSWDGTLLLTLTPALHDPASVVGTEGQGCRTLELASLDPPVLRRDGFGQLVVRAVINGKGFGSCAHDAASATGIIATGKDSSDGPWHLHRTFVYP